MHHAHAIASCPRHVFYPSLIATQKEVKYGLKKMRRNSLYVPDTVTVFTVEVRSAIIISFNLTCTLYL